MKKGLQIFIFLGVLLLIAACSNGGSITADDVISKLNAASVEAENPEKVTQDSTIKLNPEDGEIVRFKIPSMNGSSISEGSGENGLVYKDAPSGHVFILKNNDDLVELQKFYEEMGQTSEMFRSWTYVKDNMLLQMPGGVTEEQFNEYKKVIDSI
ncbi:hypothetical protein QVE09_09745 [Paenibacillus sp. ClWae2A]|uniref:hypothetical protein n=1 Tax=Paenibacillus sp. ClWae2A TaxID=3057177 RepID=UPI0028F5AB71|nr:hypothetical protein [Paenibacillus sp. ClWae2A]MDT9719184.1 hypothetical protein [Paenibacillus sp. ClWae2A]